MGCAYHAEVNAMQNAMVNANAYLNNWGGNAPAVIQGLVVGGAGAFIGTLNALDGLRLAITTYVNSGNFPAGASVAKQNQITHRRGQAFFQNRINSLNALILAFQALGGGLYPGLGAGWF
jgi:hypothetical protein